MGAVTRCQAIAVDEHVEQEQVAAHHRLAVTAGQGVAEVAQIVLDAETAERWGYLDRIFAPGEITPFVDALAARIASFPPEAVRAAKLSVNAADLPLEQGLIEEAYLFQTLLRTEPAQRNMARFLEIGGQTRAGELDVASLGAQLNQKA